MANEIQINLKFKVDDNNYQVNENISNYRETHSAYNTADGAAGVQLCGTTAEALAGVADMGNAGWGFFRNLTTTAKSSTAYIEIGSDAAVANPVARLHYGQPALLPLATKTLYVKATGSQYLRWVIDAYTTS